MTILLLIALWNWFGQILFGWLYCGLWFKTGDLEWRGFRYLWGWLPVAQFQLSQRTSWFTEMWESWYGHSLFLTIIYKDHPTTEDDFWVRRTIAHELRHSQQYLWFGLMFNVLYGLSALHQKIQGNHPYRDNWFERDARQYAEKRVP